MSQRKINRVFKKTLDAIKQEKTRFAAYCREWEQRGGNLRRVGTFFQSGTPEDALYSEYIDARNDFENVCAEELYKAFIALYPDCRGFNYYYWRMYDVLQWNYKFSLNALKSAFKEIKEEY